MFKLKTLAASISVALCFPFNALAVDTGDAPASFGLATHEVVAGAPQIGQIAAEDNAQVNTLQADGDDNDASDDEDGVFGHPLLVQNAKAYTTNVFVSNPSNTNAVLVGWIDFDGNGVFDEDEATAMPVPAGANNERIKLDWGVLTGRTTDFFGLTYARFRITTDPIGGADATGAFSNGEVEDYAFPILQDSDGDEVPNIDDLDNDNDGIPDIVEGDSIDSDNDGTPNSLDVDSDGDTIFDFAEAGNNPLSPIDSDGDGTPDFLDLDSNNDGQPDSVGSPGDADRDGILDNDEGTGDSDGDGVLNVNDLDSDNDIIPDSIERGDGAAPVDTDGDLIPDFLDLDSDNDGIPDIRESHDNQIPVDTIDTNVNTISDGRADSNLIFGANGFVDEIETQADSGVPVFSVPDTDGDSIRDFRDPDSDGDGVLDIAEAGGVDSDGDGRVDALMDANQDGLADSVENALFVINGALPDNDSDFIPDFRDENSDGSGSGSTIDTGNGTPGTGGNVVTDTQSPANSSDTGAIGIVETGLTGGAGCSVITGSRKDPLMPTLLLGCIVWLGLRRRQNKCSSSL